MTVLQWLERFRSKQGRQTAEVTPDLFDDDFQRKLEQLALVSRRAFAGRLRAERKTRKSGSGIEFTDHRDYVEGDDLRYLDWNVYQRFGRLQVRLFEEEEDLTVYLLVDASKSMGFGAAEKLMQAKKLTAALAYVALANLDRVAVCTVSDSLGGLMHPTRGKQRIFRVFQFLRSVEAEGNTDLGAALGAFAARHKRKGLAVLLSDLYDPHGFEQGINALRFGKFEVLVLHLVDRAEREPELRGDVRVVDCETGDARDVTVTRSLLERYKLEQLRYVEQIERFCRAKHVTYFACDVREPFEDLVLRVFRRGGFLR